MISEILGFRVVVDELAQPDTVHLRANTAEVFLARLEEWLKRKDSDILRAAARCEALDAKVNELSAALHDAGAKDEGAEYDL